jgi:phage gpG-like protein
MSSVQIKSNLLNLAGDVRGEIDKAVMKLALEMEADIKSRMAEGKSGAIYRRGSGTHQASAPGEAPAIDTGAYVNSIQTKKTDDGAEVGTNMEYGPFLELGTSRIAKRPHFTPAAERIEKKIPGEVAEAVNRAASKNAIR